MSAVQRFDLSTDAALPPAVRGRLNDLAQACAVQDGVPAWDEAAWLVLRGYGVGTLTLTPEGLLLQRGAEFDLAVHPDHRGQGFGTALLRSALEDGATQRAWSHADHPAAAALARSFGFAPVRRLLRMLRPPQALPPHPHRDDVQVRTFHPSDRALLLALNAEAFADHPEQGHLDVAEFEVRTAQPWFDPEGLFLAWAGEELLGFHWTKRQATVGEVYVIAVAPAAQGRGVGRLLLEAGLRHLAPHAVELYVEADNAAAVGLYRRWGFDVVETHVQYQR